MVKFTMLFLGPDAGLPLRADSSRSAALGRALRSARPATFGTDGMDQSTPAAPSTFPYLVSGAKSCGCFFFFLSFFLFSFSSSSFFAQRRSC